MSKLFTAQLVLLGLIGMNQAYADADIIAPEGVVVVQVDQQVLGQGLFTPKQARYVLPAGQHTIVAKYNRLFDTGADDHDVLKSDPVMLTFTVADQQQYQLRWANEPKDYKAAKQYAKQPILQLIDGQGQVVASQQGVAPATGSSLLGTVTQVLGVSQQPIQITPAVPVAPASTSRLQQLEQLWQSASSNERQQMATWILSQSKF